MVLLIYCHLVVGLGSNPRVPTDYHLLRWMLDAPRGENASIAYAAPGGGETWMWKQAAGLYCLVVASSHPVVEAWARLPVGSAERWVAEWGDPDGLIETRRWFDGLLRPGENSDWSNLGEFTMTGGVNEIAERFLDWSTTRAIIDKLAWLETDDGRRLATRLWKDASRQPYGFISVV